MCYIHIQWVGFKMIDVRASFYFFGTSCRENVFKKSRSANTFNMSYRFHFRFPDDSLCFRQWQNQTGFYFFRWQDEDLIQGTSHIRIWGLHKYLHPCLGSRK